MEPTRRDSAMPRRKGTAMTVNTMFGPPMGPHEMPPRMPAPCHRHATPSGPWPFLDVDDPVDQKQLNEPPTEKNPAEKCTHIDRAKCNHCWKGYPQSLYPNWTDGQQQRSRIARIVKHRAVDSCTLYYSDINRDGTFSPPQTLPITKERNEAHWQFMINPRPSTTSLRAMFLDELSGPVLQMIGTKYNVEPFFWSSSLGWIPSRYQESVDPGEGDHITITLRFVRSMDNPTTTAPPTPASQFFIGDRDAAFVDDASSISTMDQDDLPDQIIDTQAPLLLSSSDHILLPDLIALHLIRVRPPSQSASSSSDEAPSPTSPSSPSSPSAGGSSTIISFHPPTKHRTTPASTLHKRLALVGRSVYWSHIFAEFSDPTFVLLALMWYPLYAWDEAFEYLYMHVGSLESNVIHTNPLYLTTELHIVHAHILHYGALLEDFQKAVVFIRDTPNPALEHPDFDKHKMRERSNERLHTECDSLLREIKRLEDTRAMMAKRLKNVMHLGFSRVNIEDSKYMQKLAEATVADSAAMKQIAYLTMIFLPSSFVATVFGMNVAEINPGTKQTLGHYAVATVLLTLLTTWTIIAFQYPFKTTKGTNPRTNSTQQPPTSYGSSTYVGAGESSTSWVSVRSWPVALQRAVWPVIMLSDFLAERNQMQRSASEDVKVAASPQKTRPRKKWPRPRFGIRRGNRKPDNTSGGDAATGSSGFTGKGPGLGGEGGLWLPGLSRSGRGQDGNVQHVQSPGALSSIREEIELT